MKVISKGLGAEEQSAPRAACHSLDLVLSADGIEDREALLAVVQGFDSVVDLDTAEIAGYCRRGVHVIGAATATGWSSIATYEGIRRGCAVVLGPGFSTDRIRKSLDYLMNVPRRTRYSSRPTTRAPGRYRAPVPALPRYWTHSRVSS